MTFELRITAESKEELLALLGGAPTGAWEHETVAPMPTAAPTEAVAPTPTAAPTPTPTAKQYSVDEIARACAPLMNNQGGMRMLQELLAYYGAKSLKDLPKEQYSDFVAKLAALGVAV